MRCDMAKSEKRREHDRRRREAALLAKVMAEPILAELLPHPSFREDDRGLWYFQQVQDFLVASDGDVGIKFKPCPLMDLSRDGSVENAGAEVNVFVALQRRRGRRDRGGNWYFFVKVLFRGAIHREWSEKLSDRLNDHGWMRRTGRRLRAWDVQRVQGGFLNLFGVLLF